MRQIIVITSALALGCGTVQNSVDSEQEALMEGFPKPYPASLRFGKEGLTPGATAELRARVHAVVRRVGLEQPYPGDAPEVQRGAKAKSGLG